MMGLKCKIVYVVWDIDQMKPLSASVVLSFFIHSELSPFYGIIREDDALERRKLGVNKERTTVALKGFI